MKIIQASKKALIYKVFKEKISTNSIISTKILLSDASGVSSLSTAFSLSQNDLKWKKLLQRILIKKTQGVCGVKSLKLTTKVT